MKKWVRKAISVALSGALLLGASGMAGATTQADNSNNSLNYGPASADEAANDVSSFDLAKDYRALDANSIRSPSETFTYNITPYGVWNADGTYTSGVFETSGIHAVQSGFPMLQIRSGGTAVAALDTPVTFSFTADAGAASQTGTNLTDSNSRVFLPDYPNVGDYWYKVVEIAGTTAGVNYGTNSNASQTYYIHVQATTPLSGISYRRNVTLHKTAPTDATSAAYNDSNGYAATKHTDTSDKLTAIQNTYSAGELAIHKTVTGNAGDKTEYFEVTVVFTEPSGKIVDSDIFFTAHPNDKVSSNNYYLKGADSTQTYSGKTQWSSNWTGTAGSRTATVTFWIMDGETVTFTNIPYGVTYSVTETLLDDYENKLEFTDSTSYTVTGTHTDSSPSFNGITIPTSDSDTSSSTLDSTANKTAVGSISDASDTITITNEKNVVIDIGVITEDAPFVALMAVCAAAAVLMVTRKKRIFED